MAQPGETGRQHRRYRCIQKSTRGTEMCVEPLELTINGGRKEHSNKGV